MKELETFKNQKYISWYEFRSPYLNLSNHKKYKLCTSYKSCGSASLGFLTNTSPKKVEEFISNPNRGWHTGTTIRFLRSKGYGVIELSKRDVLKSNWCHHPIEENHLLLINLRCDSEENSMFLLHKNQLWHHYQLETNFNPLFFLNKPTQDVLLVYHDKWQFPKH